MQKRQFNIRISDECYEQLETLTKNHQQYLSHLWK